MEAGGSVQEAKKQGGSGSDQDLSMEEILQSIRRIIAEDDNEKKPDAGKADAAVPADAAQDTEEDVPGSDVLELTEMVKEDGSIVNVKEEDKTEAEAETPKAAPAAQEPKENSRDVLAKINEALSEPKAAPIEEKQDPAPAPAAETPSSLPAAAAPAPVPAAASTPSADSLLSQEAASAASAQFKRLGDKVVEDVHVPSPPFRSGTTVEDLVTEMLRPMMKEWLDANLPQIVERIVEREVKKLTR